MKTRIIAILGAVAASVAFVALPAGPASAHDVYQGNDAAFHSYDGLEFTICDGENDGHAVWAGYYRVGSNSYYSAPVLYPSNTSGVECTTYYPASVLSNLRVVEDNPDSSTNYYGAWHGYPVAGN
jgi:hypothetical protein